MTNVISKRFAWPLLISAALSIGAPLQAYALTGPIECVSAAIQRLLSPVAANPARDRPIPISLEELPSAAISPNIDRIEFASATTESRVTIGTERGECFIRYTDSTTGAEAFGRVADMWTTADSSKFHVRVQPMSAAGVPLGKVISVTSAELATAEVSPSLMQAFRSRLGERQRLVGERFQFNDVRPNRLTPLKHRKPLSAYIQRIRALYGAVWLTRQIRFIRLGNVDPNVRSMNEFIHLPVDASRIAHIVPNQRYIYVLTANGDFRIAAEIGRAPDLGVSKHLVLADGENVYAAGELMKLRDGTIHLDLESGSFMKDVAQPGPDALGFDARTGPLADSFDAATGVRPKVEIKGCWHNPGSCP